MRLLPALRGFPAGLGQSSAHDYVTVGCEFAKFSHAGGEKTGSAIAYRPGSEQGALAAPGSGPEDQGRPHEP
ncbi:MAG TPA: hypothetical protein VKB38_09800 [Terracidiphilus sp.]|nr:hypothetical protein [Terracidiphilus sp.]